MVTFGERIRNLANKLGKEEQDLAKDLGLTKSQLSHYINGRRKVPSELLQGGNLFPIVMIVLKR